VPSTSDFLEDAADALAGHESGYLLVGVTPDQGALCFSGNVHNLEQVEWLRRKANEYLDRRAAEFQ
jgi:hypothetical protein